MALIEPRTLKGFRDYLPEAQIPREWLIDTARKVYRSYGFLPIDTPALEYAEILTGKGGDESDKQMYRFKDHGDRDVALRFDLTVPLARFVAQHSNELGMPFKRYHIANVWRGENTQRGRYREFMQCDFDTIGTESIAADIEMVLVIHDLMLALGIEDFTIRVSNRKILNGWLTWIDMRDHSVAVLRAIDKLDKIGRDKVLEEIAAQTQANPRQIEGIDKYLEFARDVSRSVGALKALESWRKPESHRPDNELFEQGMDRLMMLLRTAYDANIPEHRLMPDLSIARGLDYYTGTIAETLLNKLPTIGSVCSGGRYDNLAQLYTKQQLPGIGASLGLDRLLAAMEELGLLAKTSATASVFLPFFFEPRLADYFRLASQLRRAGLGVELYPEPKKLGAQLKYADRRGFRFALIVGDDEWASGMCNVKDLKTGEGKSMKLHDHAGDIAPELLHALSS
jgi:histidyl-tRNA synthetase